jgi:hypothetical protein
VVDQLSARSGQSWNVPSGCQQRSSRLLKISSNTMIWTPVSRALGCQMGVTPPGRVKRRTEPPAVAVGAGVGAAVAAAVAAAVGATVVGATVAGAAVGAAVAAAGVPVAATVAAGEGEATAAG